MQSELEVVVELLVTSCMKGMLVRAVALPVLVDAEADVAGEETVRRRLLGRLCLTSLASLVSSLFGANNGTPTASGQAKAMVSL